MPARPRIAPTEDWRQIELLARAPGQRTDELIRPVVLFGQSAAERAAETGAAERTLYRQVARFDQLGMTGLAPPPKVEKHRLLPAEVRQTFLDAKREHPPLNVHELTTISWARCGHRPSSHMVKRILAESSPPPRTPRRFPPYHAIADPSQRRLAIVRPHVEGWNAKSIAAYLETSRQTVHATLKRWPSIPRSPMPAGGKISASLPAGAAAGSAWLPRSPPRSRCAAVRTAGRRPARQSRRFRTGTASAAPTAQTAPPARRSPCSAGPRRPAAAPRPPDQRQRGSTTHTPMSQIERSFSTARAVTFIASRAREGILEDDDHEQSDPTSRHVHRGRQAV